MKILIILATVLLSACGSNLSPPPTYEVRGDAGLAPAVDPNSTYTYRVWGSGITFAAVAYANFGSPDQIESPSGLITIPDASAVPLSVYGLNTVGEIAYNSGAGILTIQLLKNGVLVDTKTITSSGNSAHFNYDI